jgi:hypothetical protein
MRFNANPNGKRHSVEDCKDQCNPGQMQRQRKHDNLADHDGVVRMREISIGPRADQGLAGPNKTLLDTSDESTSLSANSDQVTVEKSLPLASLQPGKYLVKIQVSDSVSKQEIAQSAPFTVE